jgi:hypothetical protein
MTLNPARLAHFTDWAKTLPPRPLPRTVIPVAGEYFLDYIARLAEANHLEFAELNEALDDPAGILYHPHGRTQHEQERLAAAASQPLALIARLWWPGPRVYLHDPEGFRRMLRPACRRCTRPPWHHRARCLPPAAAPDRLPPPPAVDRPLRPASSTLANSPRSSALSAATSLWCTTTTTGGRSTPPSAMPR